MVNSTDHVRNVTGRIIGKADLTADRVVEVDNGIAAQDSLRVDVFEGVDC